MKAGPWKLETSLLLLSLTVAGAADPDTNATSQYVSAQRSSPARTTRAHPAPKPRKKAIYLTPHVAEVLRLAKAGIAEDVIVTYIQKSTLDLSVTPHQLISLRDAGLSTPVLKALVEHGPGAGEVPPWLTGSERAMPGRGPLGGMSQLGPGFPGSFFPGVNGSPFYSMLGAVGHWVFLPGYGWFWQPSPDPADAGGPFPGSGAYFFPGADLAWSPPVWLSSSAVFDFGFDRHHHHHHDGDQDNDSSAMSSATPWLNRNQPNMAAAGGGNPFNPVGAVQPNPGMNMPFLPVGSAGATVNSGANPFLPVGGQPGSGTAPPFGVVGALPTQNNGNFPFLPVGGRPASGNLNPFGIAPSTPNIPPANSFAQPGFPALPAAPMLPASPMLPGGPFFFHQNPQFNRGPWPLWPSWPTLPHSGFGGFHGFNGGGRGGGGGGAHGGGRH